METTFPITLCVRECANGETFECFLKLGDEPLYGPAGCGAFINQPTEREAFDGAMRVVQGRLSVA